MPDSVENYVACRICMDSKDRYVSLFTQDLSMKVMEVADVQVEENDGLPASICTDCEQDLEKCYEFRLKVQLSDRKFRENINLSQVEIEECSIKEERIADERNSDHADENNSYSMDEHHDDETEITQEMAPGEIGVDLMSQQEDINEEPPLQRIEEVALDPLVCMKEETETDIMDVDIRQPDPFGPSSSVRSSEQLGTYDHFMLSSHTLDNFETEMKQDQVLLMEMSKGDQDHVLEPRSQSLTGQIDPKNSQTSVRRTDPPVSNINLFSSPNLLPEKSKNRYELEYLNFSKWRKKRNIHKVNDDVMLDYMSELAKNLKPSSLWSKLSMVKTCLSLKENITIDSFPKTTAFVKRQNTGYNPKKSKTLTMEQVTKFMNEAPDETWLLAKTVLIFGIFGACRRDDIANFTVDDIEDNGSLLVVFVRNGKTHVSRTFTITDNGCPFKPYTIYRKYVELRPKHITSRRFFINYRNGKCTTQHVGMNSIAALPSKIAKFLNLPNPEEYTGHCFRRTSASMLVEAGADLLTLKMLGGWRSSLVAERYVEQSGRRKIEVSKQLFSKETININEQSISTEIQEQPTSTRVNEAGHSVQNVPTNMSVFQNELLNKALNITNNTNCSFTINIGKI